MGGDIENLKKRVVDRLENKKPICPKCGEILVFRRLFLVPFCPECGWLLFEDETEAQEFLSRRKNEKI